MRPLAMTSLSATSLKRETDRQSHLPSDTELRRFSELMAAHRAPLFRFLLRQGAAPDQAEDCLQEAFMRAYRSLNSLRDWAAAKSWMYGITRNVFLNSVRREAVRARPLPPADPPELPTADERAEQNERARVLRGAISSLPPPRPEIVDLHYRQGLTLEEIAQKLGMPIGTVKTNLYRARAALRKELGALETC